MNTGIENHTFLKETDFFNRNMDMHTHTSPFFIKGDLWQIDKYSQHVQAFFQA